MLGQVVGDHAGPLIRPGRTAERVGRSDHHEVRTVLHGLQLFFQQHRLWAGLPGVWHDLRGGLAVALDEIPLEVDTGRQHQPVVGKSLVVLETHAF